MTLKSLEYVHMFLFEIIGGKPERVGKNGVRACFRRRIFCLWLDLLITYRTLKWRVLTKIPYSPLFQKSVVCVSFKKEELNFRPCLREIHGILHFTYHARIGDNEEKSKKAETIDIFFRTWVFQSGIYKLYLTFWPFCMTFSDLLGVK